MSQASKLHLPTPSFRVVSTIAFPTLPQSSSSYRIHRFQ
ncbi:unnamed protein product [Brassica napus]|uniref:(rape) hypothetical protein n=1 Tax=Brassica napus TaxID=3708 RepID=A0A816VV94_BRANA|nr:unnamed protein product [Brassica napus]